MRKSRKDYNVTSLGESQTCIIACRCQFTVEHVHISWLSHEPLSLLFSTSHARHHLLSWRTQPSLTNRFIQALPESFITLHTRRIHYTAGSVQCPIRCCGFYIFIVNHVRHQHLAWMSYRTSLLISIST